MIKLFEHVSTYHRTTETLTIKECGQGLYVGVNSCEIIPSERVGELNYDEQTTSIVVPLSEITNLIQSLSKVASGWIDASERLPEKHTTVLVVYHAHFDDEPITEFDVCTAFFDGETFDPKDQLFYQKRNTTVT